MSDSRTLASLSRVIGPEHVRWNERDTWRCIHCPSGDLAGYAGVREHVQAHRDLGLPEVRVQQVLAEPAEVGGCVWAVCLRDGTRHHCDDYSPPEGWEL